MTSFTSFDCAFQCESLFQGLFAALKGGNRLETCDPQLYISLHCLCYDESRAISDQVYASLYLLSSHNAPASVEKKSFGPTHPTASVTWTTGKIDTLYPGAQS